MEFKNIRTVAAVGAGTMGQGIAMICAQAGYNTLLFDIDSSLSSNALLAIDKNLAVLLQKGRLSLLEKEDIQKRISVVKQLADVQADVIVEAVVEKLEVKQQLFQELERVNNNAILATNTSSISVTQIALGLRNPSNCIGLHFFNPAHLMKLVEIISGEETNPKLIPVFTEFSKKIGKIPVIAKDSPGFIVNRVARHYYLESLRLLEENNGEVSSIDELLKSAGFKLGPFELMDLIGVDINLAVTTSIYHGFGEASKFRPSKIQQQKVRAGHLGRKTGKGFYDYAKN